MKLYKIVILKEFNYFFTLLILFLRINVYQFFIKVIGLLKR